MDYVYKPQHKSYWLAGLASCRKCKKLFRVDPLSGRLCEVAAYQQAPSLASIGEKSPPPEPRFGRCDRTYHETTAIGCH